MLAPAEFSTGAEGAAAKVLASMGVAATETLTLLADSFDSGPDEDCGAASAWPCEVGADMARFRGELGVDGVVGAAVG